MNNIQDYDDIYRRSLENSLQSRRTEVYGESYTSKKEERKKKIKEAKHMFLMVCSVIVITGSFPALGIIDTSNKIREEVHSTYEHQDSINGKGEYVNVYDENFIDYTDDLNDLELQQLYQKTSNSVHSNDMDRVVYEMEKNYLEEEGRGK